MSDGFPKSSPPQIPVGLIIPALNEEESIGLTLDGIRDAGLAQVLVVDNGSTDRTSAIARQHGAQVVIEPRRGYGQACLAGIAALRPEIEIVVFMDADGSDDPSGLFSLLQPICAGTADFVLGSRRAGFSEAGAMAPQQAWGNRLATSLLRWMHGANYSDLGPFRAIRRDSLDALQMKDTGFGWTMEMQIKAYRAGLRVMEIPVCYRKRRKGQSKISGTLRGTVMAGSKILWTVLKYR
jgi:glycosyltransferase involved in cell wall biosynthesis